MLRRLLSTTPNIVAFAVLFIFLSVPVITTNAYAVQPNINTLSTPQTENTETINWGGNGNENADPECVEGETPYWHWILTPGGNNELLSATLTVVYGSGETTVTNGVFRGNNNGNGAMHFDVTRDGADVVSSAEVTFTYREGKGRGNNNENFVLTISDSGCRENDKTDDEDDENGNGGENNDDATGVLGDQNLQSGHIVIEQAPVAIAATGNVSSATVLAGALGALTYIVSLRRTFSDLIQIDQL